MPSFLMPMSMIQQAPPRLDQHLVLSAPGPGGAPTFVTTTTTLPVAMRTEPPSAMAAPLSRPLSVVMEPAPPSLPRVELYRCNTGQTLAGEACVDIPILPLIPLSFQRLFLFLLLPTLPPTLYLSLSLSLSLSLCCSLSPSPPSNLSLYLSCSPPSHLPLSLSLSL